MHFCSLFGFFLPQQFSMRNHLVLRFCKKVYLRRCYLGQQHCLGQSKHVPFADLKNWQLDLSCSTCIQNIVGHNYNTICNKRIILSKQKMDFSETVPINVLSQIASLEVKSLHCYHIFTNPCLSAIGDLSRSS